jgi:transposase
MSRQVRKYTKEFKQEAVKLAIRKPSIAEAAKDLGIPLATLHSWVNAFKKPTEGKSTDSTTPDTAALLAENRRLQKELAILKEEKEILKKAAAYFAREQK